MASQQYMKFYPSDWLGDPALRHVSMEAECLWLRLILRMVDQDTGGRIPDDLSTARAVGVDPRKWRRLRLELVGAGVCDIEAGMIVSRRLVREHAKREKDAHNGRLGGRKSAQSVCTSDKAFASQAAEVSENSARVLGEVRKGGVFDFSPTSAACDSMITREIRQLAEKTGNPPLSAFSENSGRSQKPSIYQYQYPPLPPLKAEAARREGGRPYAWVSLLDERIRASWLEHYAMPISPDPATIVQWANLPEIGPWFVGNAIDGMLRWMVRNSRPAPRSLRSMAKIVEDLQSGARQTEAARDPLVAAQDQQREQVDFWRRTGRWYPDRDGPQPDQPGCRIDLEILAEAGIGVAAKDVPEGVR